MERQATPGSSPQTPHLYSMWNCWSWSDAWGEIQRLKVKEAAFATTCFHRETIPGCSLPPSACSSYLWFLQSSSVQYLNVSTAALLPSCNNYRYCKIIFTSRKTFSTYTFWFLFVSQFTETLFFFCLISIKVVNFVKTKKKSVIWWKAVLHCNQKHILPYSFNNRGMVHIESTIPLLCSLTGHYIPLSALPLWEKVCPAECSEWCCYV